MRGVSLASFIGPGVSARYSCIPPRPSIGSTATTSRMMPRPPTYCRKQRQMFTDTGSVSSPTSAVDPVAVSALIASKYAVVQRMPGTVNISGAAA